MTAKKTTTPEQTAAKPAGGETAAAPVITSVDQVKFTAELDYQTLITGLGSVLGDITSFVLPSGTYTPAALVEHFQERIAAAEVTKASYTKWRADAAAEKKISTESDSLREEIRQVAIGRLGKSSEKLKQLGFNPAKPRKVSSATKAAAQAKAKATRERRAAAAAGTTNGNQGGGGASTSSQGGTKGS